MESELRDYNKQVGFFICLVGIEVSVLWLWIELGYV